MELLGHKRAVLWCLISLSPFPQNFKILSTGGDDLKMKGWDVRRGFGSPIFENQR